MASPLPRLCRESAFLPDTLRCPVRGRGGLADVAAAAAAAVPMLVARLPDPGLPAAVSEAIRLLDAAEEGHKGRGPRYARIPPSVQALVHGRPGFVPVLVASLLAGIEARAAARAVPVALLPELERQARRILAAHAAGAEKMWAAALPLEEDAFLKDLAICRLTALPCVAQIVEEGAGVPRSALLSGGAGQAFRLAARLAAAGFRNRPYLEFHTHTPMLDGFTPAGWDRCYALAAELLRRRPDLLGVVGGSWFYDPFVGSISPRLAYLVDVPRRGGAYFLRLRSTPADTDLATATSPTRRRLVEEGRYRPARFMMVWPRAALLAWVEARDAAGPGGNGR